MQVCEYLRAHIWYTCVATVRESADIICILIITDTTKTDFWIVVIKNWLLNMECCIIWFYCVFIWLCQLPPPLSFVTGFDFCKYIGCIANGDCREKHCLKWSFTFFCEEKSHSQTIHFEAHGNLTEMLLCRFFFLLSSSSWTLIDSKW